MEIWKKGGKKGPEPECDVWPLNRTEPLGDLTEKHTRLSNIVADHFVPGSKFPCASFLCRLEPKKINGALLFPGFCVPQRDDDLVIAQAEQPVQEADLEVYGWFQTWATRNVRAPWVLQRWG